MVYPTGIRAVDHAVETLCSIDANAYTDGTARQALRLLSAGLPAVKSDPGNLDARLQCLMSAWMSMVGIVTGTRLGASHAIGHILGGTANVPHGLYLLCHRFPLWRLCIRWTTHNREAVASPSMGRPGVPASQVLDEFIAGLELPRSLGAVGVDAGADSNIG